MAKFLKKITPKTVCEQMTPPLDLLKLGDVRPVPSRHLYNLFGTINRVKQGQTDKGPWVQFKGRFQAVTEDGEVFDSGAAHIPGGMEDIIFGTLDEARAAANGSPVSLEIALSVDIATAPSGKPSMTGYEFNVQPLIQRELKADDPIARLRAEAAQTQLKLSAPKSEAKPESAPAPMPETSRGKK